MKSAIEYVISAFKIVENPRKTTPLFNENIKKFKTLNRHGSSGIVDLEKLIEHSNYYIKYCSPTLLFSK